MPKEEKQANDLEKLDSVLSNLQKKFGKGSIALFGKNTIKVERVPLSSMNLTRIFGGGCPRGRIIEVYGAESSGKSSLAELLASDYQHHFFEDKNRYGRVAYIDVEHAFDPEYARVIGVDVENLIFSQPDSAEQALDMVEALVTSDLCDLIVIDSVAALTPMAEIDGEMGDQQMALRARLMSKACGKLSIASNPTSATILFINQTRQKIGTYGNPECVTPDTLITRGSIETQETMEKLFSLCGANWRVMTPGDSIDVSSKGVLVSSFNEDKKIIEDKKVLKLIRKADSPVLSVQTTAGVELFKASLAHKIFASTDGGKTFNWCDLLSLKGNNDIIVKSIDSGKVYEQDIQIQGYGAVYPILDFEVEGNHNYFANGVLSHNTTTGGNALRFYASVRLTTRRKEYVGAADAPEGIVTVVKAIKNKVTTPFRSCEVKLLFGKGYQVEEEFISAFVERELIQKGGSWYTIVYADKDGKELSERVQGLEKVIDFFKSNPEVFEVYKQKIHALIEKETSVTTLDQDKEEDKDTVDKQQERLEKEALDL